MVKVDIEMMSTEEVSRRSIPPQEESSTTGQAGDTTMTFFDNLGCLSNITDPWFIWGGFVTPRDAYQRHLVSPWVR